MICTLNVNVFKFYYGYLFCKSKIDLKDQFSKLSLIHDVFELQQPVLKEAAALCVQVFSSLHTQRAMFSQPLVRTILVITTVG